MRRDEELINILKRLSEAYPGLKGEKGMIEAYLENLRDVPAWLLKKAVKKQTKSSQWFPKVAELRQTAAALAGTSNFISPRTTAAPQAVATPSTHYSLTVP